MPETPKKNSDREYYLFALRIAGDFGASIAVPAILAALLGSYLDVKYVVYPIFTVICLLVAFSLTALMIRKKAKRYGEQYQKMK